MIRRIFTLLSILMWLAACNYPAPGRSQPPQNTATATLSTVLPVETPLSPTGAPDPVPDATPTSEAVAEILPTRVEANQPSPSPTITVTSAPVLTPVFTNTPEPTQGVDTAPQQGVNAILWFILQPGSPAYTTNFVRVDAGCNFTGVAGQVFDEAGSPVANLLVQAQGVLDGQPVTGLDITGLSEGVGPGGYVIHLADRAIASQGSISLQLLDFNAVPLSAPVVIDTFSDCEQNLALVNFIDAPGPVFLPVVVKP